MKQLVIILLLTSIVSFGQELSFETVTRQSQFHSGGGGNTEFLHLNDDSSIDALLHASDGNTFVYINNGQGFFNLKQTFQGVKNGKRTTGDIDGDGDIDFIDIVYNHHVVVYKNDGTGSFQAFGDRIEGYSESQASYYMVTLTKLVDVDNDLDLDLLITGWTSEHSSENYSYFTFLYQNNGHGAFTKNEQVDFGNFNMLLGRTVLFDINNDSQKDIVYPGRCYLRDSLSYSLTSFPILDTSSNIGLIFSDDLDNDLKDDLIFYNDDLSDVRVIELFQGELRYKEGIDKSYFAPLDELYVRSVLDHPIPVDSINNDLILLNDYLISNPMNVSDVADVDGDGDLDFVNGGAIYFNTGTSFERSRAFQFPGKSFNFDIDLMQDFNGDSLIDMALANWTGFGVYLNDGNLGNYLTFEYNHRIDVGDIDGDDDIDIIGSNKIYVNDGSGNFETYYDVNGNYDPSNWNLNLTNWELYYQRYTEVSSVLGDVDNDGDNDIIVSGNYYFDWPVIEDFRNVTHIWLNNGAGQFTIQSGVPVASSQTDFLATPLYSLHSWDINADNYSDIIRVNIGAAGQHYNDVDLEIYINNKNGGFTKSEAEIGEDMQNHVILKTGDYDNDGHLDIIIRTRDFNNEDRVFIYESELDSFIDGEGIIPNYPEFCLTDIDGDSDDDFIVGGGTGNIFEVDTTQIYLNDGYGGFELFPFETFTNVGFFDGDKTLDLTDGVNYVYLNNKGTSGWVNSTYEVDDYFEKSRLKVLTIFPNPASDYVNVYIDNHSVGTDYSIKILNPQGSTIYQESISSQNHSLNLSGLEKSGLFLIQLLDNDGKIIEVNKVLLE